MLGQQQSDRAAIIGWSAACWPCRLCVPDHVEFGRPWWWPATADASRSVIREVVVEMLKMCGEETGYSYADVSSAFHIWEFEGHVRVVRRWFS